MNLALAFYSIGLHASGENRMKVVEVSLDYIYLNAIVLVAKFCDLHENLIILYLLIII